MRRFFCAAAAALALAACAAPVVTLERYEQMGNAELWLQHQMVNNVQELTFIEAELARRGQTKSGADYLGRRTSSAEGRTTFARGQSVTGDKNCGDFGSGHAAQKFFLKVGGPSSDPHGLDRDGDGFACEWGAEVKRVAAKNAPRPKVTTYRRPASSRCYVGPRGGTYTITASGNKNYGGC